MLFVAGLLALLALNIHIHSAKRPPIGVGATFWEYNAQVNAEEKAARQHWVPCKKRVVASWTAGGLKDLRALNETEYYFRKGHNFLVCTVHFQFTNGVLVRVSRPRWKWYFDL
jgi:hypothetical protein